jgi:hypothetical protein
MVETAPVSGEGVGDVVEAHAEAFGFDDELFEFTVEEQGTLGRGGLARKGDDGAGAGENFEEAFVEELRDDFVGGVGIDFEFGAEGTDGGEWVAGAELSGDQGAFRGVDDLLVEGGAGSEVDAKGDHFRCIMTPSTGVVKDES